MAYTMSFGRITGIDVISIKPSRSRVTKQVNIPGGYGAFYSYGVQSDSYSLECQFLTPTISTAQTKFQQLVEIAQNPLWYWDYVVFPQNRSYYDGFYVLESVDSSELYWHGTKYFPFTLKMTRVGTLGNSRMATYWYAGAAETVVGWPSLTSARMISVPNGSTNLPYTVSATRTTSDGTVQIIDGPTEQNIAYSSSATISNWFLSECRVYDTGSVGQTTESLWAQVFSPIHVFTGDRVFQNGLLRLVISGTSETWYVYDSVSVSKAWVSIGTMRSIFTDGNDALCTRLEITQLTPDALRWTETRMYLTRRVKFSYTLRRGSQHCRILGQAFGDDLNRDDAVFLSGTYTNIFNASASGAIGAGGLTTDSTYNYQCGYSTSYKFIAGWALVNKPTYQPSDGGGNELDMAHSITTGNDQVFALFAFPYNTSSFSLTTARATAAQIAAEAIYNVEQELIIVPAGS